MESFISIINANSFNSGLGRYANFLYEATKPSSNLINLRMDKRMVFNHGNTIDGLFPPVTNGWAFNTRFYDIIFNRKLSKLADRTIFHYSTELGRPVGKSVVTIHDLFFLKYPDNYPAGFRRWLGSNLKYYKKLDNIIAISEYTKKHLIEEGFEGTITRIYPPVSPNIYKIEDASKSQIREELNLPLNRTLVLVVASNEKRKNLEVVRKIIENKDFTIVCVGSEIQGSIAFSNLDEHTLNLLYNACDILLSPSIDEGFGFPVAEAMTAGLPVVASDIEVYNEITDGHAILVDSSDKQDIMSGIMEALSGREELSKNGIVYAKNFAFTSFKSQIQHYYSMLFPDVNKFS